jgi:hypothetical protein
VPTSALFDAWEAEGENVDEVAYWFKVPTAVVVDAIRFEKLLNEKEAAVAA